jgi:hypothetical protein
LGAAAAADEDDDDASWAASLDAPTRAVLLCGALLLA